MGIFKKTPMQKAIKFATTNHPTLNNVAAGIVITTAAAPLLKPVGTFLLNIGKNLLGHASNVTSGIGAKFTRASERSATGT